MKTHDTTINTLRVVARSLALARIRQAQDEIVNAVTVVWSALPEDERARIIAFASAGEWNAEWPAPTDELGKQIARELRLLLRASARIELFAEKWVDDARAIADAQPDPYSSYVAPNTTPKA